MLPTHQITTHGPFRTMQHIPQVNASFVGIYQATIMVTHAQLPNLSMENHAFLQCTQKMASGRTKMAIATASTGMGRSGVALEPNVDMENTHAHSAVVTMAPSHVHLSDLFPIMTPLIAEGWEQELHHHGLYDTFVDIPLSLCIGFNMGIHSTIQHTYIPPNHTSATNNPEVIETHIAKE